MLAVGTGHLSVGLILGYELGIFGALGGKVGLTKSVMFGAMSTLTLSP